MNCLYPSIVYISTDKKYSRYKSLNKTDTKIKVRCRHCVICIDERIRIWTYRLMAEAQRHKKMAFITLTYDDDHLPANGSCCVADVQKFMKRLRRYYSYHGNELNLSYFGCTEYGGEFGRPHAHLLILGLDSNDLFPVDKKLVSNNTVNCSSRFWKKGILNYGTDVSLCDSRLIRYCTKYVEKLDSDNLKKFCYIMGLEKPKTVFSMGIGSEYLQTKYNDDGSLPSLNGLRVSLPPYWSKKLDLASNQEDWHKGQIQKEINKQKRDKLMRGQKNTDEAYGELVTRMKRGIK